MASWISVPLSAASLACCLESCTTRFSHADSGSSSSRGRVKAARIACSCSHTVSPGLAAMFRMVVTLGIRFSSLASRRVVLRGEPSFLDGTVYAGTPSRVYQCVDSAARGSLANMKTFLFVDDQPVLICTVVNVFALNLMRPEPIFSEVP